MTMLTIYSQVTCLNIKTLRQPRWLAYRNRSPHYNLRAKFSFSQNSEVSILRPWDLYLGPEASYTRSQYCCDLRLVQIRNQAAPSELAPKCLYRRPSWLEINLAHCCIYRLMYPSEITSQFIPLNNNRLWAREQNLGCRLYSSENHLVNLIIYLPRFSSHHYVCSGAWLAWPSCHGHRASDGKW